MQRDCMCVPGTEPDAPTRTHTACRVCPQQAYCPGNDTMAIVCPEPHTATILRENGSLPTSALDCSCIDGYYRQNPASACILCPQGSWCAAEEQHQCPAATQGVLVTGAATSAACYGTCGPGKYPVSNQMQCNTCPVDAYCNGLLLQPRACPSFSSTADVTGAATVAQCTCDAGYFHTQPTNPCTLCLTGMWCAGGETLPRQCTTNLQCTNEQFKSACTALRDATCVQCLYPPFTHPVPNTPQHPTCAWTCDSGYFLSATTQLCTRCKTSISCGAGFIATPCTNTTDTTCASCPLAPQRATYTTPNSCIPTCENGFWYNAATHECCNNGSYKDNNGACVCLPGWVGDGDECIL